MRARQAAAGPIQPSIDGQGDGRHRHHEGGDGHHVGRDARPGEGTGDGGHRPQPAADEAGRRLGQVQGGPVPEVLVARLAVHRLSPRVIIPRGDGAPEPRRPSPAWSDWPAWGWPTRRFLPPDPAAPAIDVRVVIPARDEADVIAACVASVVGPGDRGGRGRRRVVRRHGRAWRRPPAPGWSRLDGDPPPGLAGQAPGLPGRARTGATTEWLAFVDADVVLHPSALATMAAATTADVDQHRRRTGLPVVLGAAAAARAGPGPGPGRLPATTSPAASASSSAGTPTRRSAATATPRCGGRWSTTATWPGSSAATTPAWRPSS